MRTATLNSPPMNKRAAKKLAPRGFVAGCEGEVQRVWSAPIGGTRRIPMRVLQAVPKVLIWADSRPEKILELQRYFRSAAAYGACRCGHPNNCISLYFDAAAPDVCSQTWPTAGTRRSSTVRHRHFAGQALDLLSTASKTHTQAVTRPVPPRETDIPPAIAVRRASCSAAIPFRIVASFAPA